VILGEQQRFLSRIPDREREHPPEQPDTVRAVFLVQVEDHLHVTTCAEAMARLDESLAQLRAVIDFAVAD
jgi:uncharacterized protein (DUF2267 family)